MNDENEIYTGLEHRQTLTDCTPYVSWNWKLVIGSLKFGGENLEFWVKGWKFGVKKVENFEKIWKFGEKSGILKNCKFGKKFGNLENFEKFCKFGKKDLNIEKKIKILKTIGD